MENETKHNVFASKPQEETERPVEIPVDHQRYSFWDHTSVVVCADCGCLVLGTKVIEHNQFHSSVNASPTN